MKARGSLVFFCLFPPGYGFWAASMSDLIHTNKRFLKRIVLAATLVIGNLASASAQAKMQPPPFGEAHVGGYDPIKEDFERGRIPPEPRYGPAKEKRVLTKGLLAPSADDRFEHEAFLKQPDTGLIKLLPREIFDWRTYHTEKRLAIRGGGAYYSFFNLTHEYGYGSDLELDHNMFLVGFAGADFGMMVNLGDVPLSDVSAKDSRAAFLATYRPPLYEPEARCEFKRFREGVVVDEKLYKRSLPVRVNSTYLLRSINYGRSDVLIGFRVARQEPDGSVIIAWKKLKEWRRPDIGRVLYVNPVNKCPIK